MTVEEINLLVKDFFDKEMAPPNPDYEHRVDPDSEKQIYSMIRKFKPETLLEIGSSHGGSTSVIMAAIQKNGNAKGFTSSELLDDLRTEAEINVLRACGGESPVFIGDITKNLHRVPEQLDFLMVDNDHDLATTVWIFEHILPRVKKGSLIVFHDWDIWEDDKGLHYKGGEKPSWQETEMMANMYIQGVLPMEKVFWTYNNPGVWETSFWTKK